MTFSFFFFWDSSCSRGCSWTKCTLATCNLGTVVDAFYAPSIRDSKTPKEENSSGLSYFFKCFFCQTWCWWLFPSPKPKSRLDVILTLPLVHNISILSFILGNPWFKFNHFYPYVFWKVTLLLIISFTR